MTEIRNFLQRIDQKLNAIQIPATVGKNRLTLSKRSISDLIEKYCIDILMIDYPEMVHPTKEGKAFDVVIDATPNFNINIKTEFRGQYRYDAIWLCSQSVLEKMLSSLKETLYYLRLEYDLDDIVHINQVSFAGPLRTLENQLIIFDKATGRMTQDGREINCRLAKKYNGRHVHLLTSAFINV